MPLILVPNNNTDIYDEGSSVYGSKYFYIKNNKMLSLLRHYEYNIKERNGLYMVDENKTSQSITFKYKTNNIDTRLQLGYHSYPLINNGTLYKEIKYEKFKKRI